MGGKQLLEEARAEIDFWIMQQGEIEVILAVKTGQGEIEAGGMYGI